MVLGKVVLQGTIAERLNQLDKRETELINECESLKATIKKMKSSKHKLTAKVEEKE